MASLEKVEIFMLQKSFENLIDALLLEFFKKIFDAVKEREGSLSAMEAFAVEVIHELKEPTIREFAEFLNISQSNATYKVNSLIKKGYIEKQNSSIDRREYHLVLTNKYYDYTNYLRTYIANLSKNLELNNSEVEIEACSRILDAFTEEIKSK